MNNCESCANYSECSKDIYHASIERDYYIKWSDRDCWQPIKNKSFIGGDVMSNLFDKDWDLTEAAHILMEDIEKNSTKESMEDTMVRASIKAGLGKQQLINTKINEGLIGVYLLGMKHMYQYLKE